MRRLTMLFAFLVAFAAPLRAGDDVADGQQAIRSQAEAFERDDTAAAYSYAAPSIQQMFPQAEIFMGMVRNGYPPVYRHKSFRFGESNTVDGRIEQTVHIVDADGMAWDALYMLERQPDGTMKISGCSLKAVGQSA